MPHHDTNPYSLAKRKLGLTTQDIVEATGLSQSTVDFYLGLDDMSYGKIDTHMAMAAALSLPFVVKVGGRKVVAA